MPLPAHHVRVEDSIAPTTERPAGTGGDIAQVFGAYWNDQGTNSHLFTLEEPSTVWINAFSSDFDLGNDGDALYLAVEIVADTTVLRSAIVETTCYDSQWHHMSYTGVTSLPAGTYIVRLRLFGVNWWWPEMGFTAIAIPSTGQETMQ